MKIMSNKMCLVWPAQAVITESLFRHYSMLAEVAGYLVDISPVISYVDMSISIEDCAVVIERLHEELLHPR